MDVDSLNAWVGNILGRHEGMIPAMINSTRLLCKPPVEAGHCAGFPPNRGWYALASQKVQGGRDQRFKSKVQKALSPS